jgi:hypothetical protein
MSKSDTLDGFAVNRWVSVANTAIDFVSVWKQVNIGRPAGDLVLLGEVTPSVGVYFDSDKVLIHRGNESRIMKCFLVEKFSGWAIVAIKMEENDAVGRCGPLNSGFVVFGPRNFAFDGEDRRGRQELNGEHECREKYFLHELTDEKRFCHRVTPCYAQTDSVENDDWSAVSLASVATDRQVDWNLRKGQKIRIVPDRAVCRLTWGRLDAKLETKARDLTDRFDSFIR